MHWSFHTFKNKSLFSRLMWAAMQHPYSPAGHCCAEAGKGSGHPHLPWSLKALLRRIQFSSLLTGGIVLGMPNAAAIPSLPWKPNQKREMQAGGACSAIAWSCPAPKDERLLPGGDSRWGHRPKWQGVEYGAIEFDGSGAFNCSTSKWCHAGSSLATGSKKNTEKKKIHLLPASPAAQAGFVAFSTGAKLATKILPTSV